MAVAFRIILLGEMLDILLVLTVEHGRILVLVNVALRWLICLLFSFQLSLLLSLFLSFYRGLFHSFLVSLDLSELFEDVLVVEEGVSELLLEEISLQESGDSVLQ